MPRSPHTPSRNGGPHEIPSRWARANKATVAMVRA